MANQIIQDSEANRLNVCYPDVQTILDHQFGQVCLNLGSGVSAYFQIGDPDDSYWKPGTPTSRVVDIFVVYYSPATNAPAIQLGYSGNGSTESINSALTGAAGGTNQWAVTRFRQTSFYVDNTAYGDSFNNADFRIYSGNSNTLLIAAVAVYSEDNNSMVRWPSRIFQQSEVVAGEVSVSSGINMYGAQGGNANAGSIIWWNGVLVGANLIADANTFNLTISAPAVIVGPLVQLLQTTVINANTTISADHNTWLVDVSGGAVTVTIPSGSTSIVGMHIFLMKNNGSANNLVASRQGTDNINGANTFTVAAAWSGIWLTYIGNGKWLARNI